MNDKQAIAYIVEKLFKAGWVPVKVDDGDGWERFDYAAGEPLAMFDALADCVDATGEASVMFKQRSMMPCITSHSVLFIMGNAPYEVAADWNYSPNDPDGFDAAMNSATDQLENECIG
jgi:hypothetical protein